MTAKIVYSSFVTTIDAGVAQLVELHVANVVVAGSSPVSRSVHEESPVRPCGPTGFFASIVASRFMNRKLIAKSQNHFGSTVLGLPFLAYPGALLFAVFLVGCGAGSGEPEHTIIPLPASVEWTVADTFHFTEETRILFDSTDTEAERIGEFLSGLIGNSTETMPAVEAYSTDVADGGIYLTREGASSSLGSEGYELTVTGSQVTVRAVEPAGLFYGIQTIRHLLPPVVEYTAAYPRPLFLPGVHITDQPRFQWRGTMLDVARHFLPLHDVKRFIDLAALYKLNRLHLHLSDDQGWRVEIPGWPNLTEHGGSTEVGGGVGGYYSTDEYTELVEYAQERFVTVIPEIDMPGHTNAALASYAEFNCDGIARDLYIGTNVGFSTLCVDKDITYEFLDDVIREISSRTPGPYFHVGGDEVEELSEEEYITFIERMQSIVNSYGKRMIGWDEIALADLEVGSVVQLWRPYWPSDETEDMDSAQAALRVEFEAGILRAVDAGATVVLSPADRLYLDMKYDTSTVLGLTWAGIPDERGSYDWKISDKFSSLPEGAIAGVEAPLWSETLGTLEDFEYMAFPRLAGVAELGWTSASLREWAEYRMRLGAQSARWTVLGINFRRSPLIPWDVGPSEH